MAIITNAPRGTQDVLPSESAKWKYVEQTTLDTARLFGFREVRIPMFEHTELFNRSVGDTTDVVQKEMYTFNDKGGRSITLRPEGTAGVMRSVLQNGLLNGPLPLKASYVISCFRYEKPQAGRLREFHQFGIEMVGAGAPVADAQAIAVGNSIFQRLGIKNISLEINSIGCPNCRPQYYEKLRAYFEERKGELCETCQGRLETNPMRLLDCKSPICQGIAADAPKAADHLCGECRDHFAGLQEHLQAMGIAFTINPKIVRGLDYYTRTVFEFVSNDIGSQGTVIGGGRYDGLLEELGGPSTPSVGFAMGLERLLMIMENQGCVFPEEKPCALYLGTMGEKAGIEASRLCNELRAEGFYTDCDLMARSVKAQMKYADKLGAKFTGIIGDEELEKGVVRLKRMETGETAEVKLDKEALAQFLYNGTLEDLQALAGADFHQI